MLSYHVTHLVHVMINPCTVVTLPPLKTSWVCTSGVIISSLKHYINQDIFVALRSVTTAQFHLFLGHDTFSKPYGAQHFEFFGPINQVFTSVIKLDFPRFTNTLSATLASKGFFYICYLNLCNFFPTISCSLL